MRKIEYVVREIRQFEIVRSWSEERGGGVETLGRFDKVEDAHRVAEALIKSEPGAIMQLPGSGEST